MPETDRFNPEGLALSANYKATMEECILPAIAARCTEKTI